MEGFLFLLPFFHPLREFCDIGFFFLSILQTCAQLTKVPPEKRKTGTSIKTFSCEESFPEKFCNELSSKNRKKIL
jgi:hypothetical protein